MTKLISTQSSDPLRRPQTTFLVPKLHQRFSSAAGIAHCGRTIIKEEGTRALWKGLTPFATHLTLKYALRMGTNAFYQKLLRDEVPRPYVLFSTFAPQPAKYCSISIATLRQHDHFCRAMTCAADVSELAAWTALIQSAGHVLTPSSVGS